MQTHTTTNMCTLISLLDACLAGRTEGKLKARSILPHYPTIETESGLKTNQNTSLQNFNLCIYMLLMIHPEEKSHLWSWCWCKPGVKNTVQDQTGIQKQLAVVANTHHLCCQSYFWLVFLWRFRSAFSRVGALDTSLDGTQVQSLQCLSPCSVGVSGCGEPPFKRLH